MKQKLYTYITIVAIWSQLAGCSGAKVIVSDNKLAGIVPLENGQAAYRQTFAAQDLSKDEIYRRARRWWVMNYKNSKDVLQLSDDKTGELIGKGYNQVVTTRSKGEDPISFLLRSTMAVDVKEGGYTVTVNQMAILSSWMALPGVAIEQYKRSPEKNLVRVMNGVDQQVKQTYASLNKYILKEELN